MRRALRLARRGDGAVSPNPMVGAVLVRDGVVVGEGWHRRFGGPHAEHHALADADDAARGATLYVTLEPCAHHGKTPPCSDAIIQAGITRVIVAMTDPNRAVTGGGIDQLRTAGLDVTVGLLGHEAARLNESFLRHVASDRPFVRLKSAASLDGRIATAQGESRWITGEEARRWAHRVRRLADAILVGVGTVLADDPRLDVRDDRPAKDLLRIVLDSRLKTPPAARLLGLGGRARIYTTKAAPARRRRALEAAGAEVIAVGRAADRQVSVGAVLQHLGRRGIGRLLVEGGGRVAASFVKRRAVDRLSTVYAPMLLGADGVAAIGDLAVRRLRSAARFEVDSIRRLGNDVLIEWIQTEES